MENDTTKAGRKGNSHVPVLEEIRWNITWNRLSKGAVVVVIAWWLDLQLPMQLVPITTKVVSSNLVHGEVTRYNIMW